MLKQTFLYIMILLYLSAGINHFINPLWYEKIIPEILPNAPLINMIAGVCEILFALLLIPVSTRRIGAWLLILLLIAVFPANIKMCIDYYHQHQTGFGLTVARLPLQFVLIGWAYVYVRKDKK